MRVWTYILHKGCFQLYTEIHDSIPVNTCQTNFQKYIVLLSDTAVILCRAGSHMGVKIRYVKFTLPAGTYSFNEFNAKIKTTVLQ